MTHFAPFLMGFMAGAVAAGFILRWPATLLEILRDDVIARKPRSQLVWQLAVVSLLTSGPWALGISAYVTYRILNNPHEPWWIFVFIGFYGALPLFGLLVAGFSQAGSQSLLMRVGLALRRKDRFMRFGIALSCLFSVPFLAELFDAGVSGEYLVFGALVWMGACYLGFLFMWQFMPMNPASLRQGTLPQEQDGGRNTA